MADIGASNWSETDASNTSAAPDGMPEGMAPSGVNDWGRATMGAVKRFYDWSIIKATAGTTTAYTLSYSVAPGALIDGMTHLVEFNAANGVAPTLNVNALGAKPIHYYSAGAWRVIPTGLLGANQVAEVAYNTAAGAYRLLDLKNDTGTIVPYGAATAPVGALLCDGSAVSRTDYVGLFTAISTTFGGGNGTTTFNVPDMRGRVAANVDGGTGRITVAGTLGTTAGAEKSGTMDAPSTTTLVEGNAVGNPILVAGQSHSHANTYVMQPTVFITYVIKT